MAVFAAALRGLPQPTLSKSHGSKGFSICGLPGLTQRGTRHFPPNAHVAGRVLVLRPNRQLNHRRVLFERCDAYKAANRLGSEKGSRE